MSKLYRVGIWCAVSSGPQAADDKISLAAQEAAGRDFARAIGGQVVSIYTVPGHSRDIIFYTEAEKQMEAYRRLREDIEAGRIDILHVTDPDRLGRDPALAHQVLSLVEKSGAEVYCATSPHIIGQKGIGQRYIFAIQATRAGEDQQRRAEYLRQGMKKRQEMGLHANNWPYGYKPIYDGKKSIGAEFDESQIGAIHLITEQFLAGATYEAIARAVQDAGYKPPRRRKAEWDKTTIRRILANQVYAGFVKWSGETSSTTSTLFPAVWDCATFAAIRQEIEYRQNRFGRKTHSMFSHVVFCARCGSPMYRTLSGHKKWGSGRQPALQCSSHKVSRCCHANTIREKYIEAALIEYLTGFLDNATIEASFNLGQRVQIDEQVSRIDKQIEDVKRGRERIALALAADKMSVDIYAQTDKSLSSDLEILSKKRAKLLSQFDAFPTLEMRHHALIQVRDIANSLFTLEPARINAMLRTAGIVVKCENSKITAIEIGTI